jgi:hypothetical protein
VRETWRTYVSFALVGAIVIFCQALSGGVSTNQPELLSAAAGDSSYRDLLRTETSGRADATLAGDIRPSLAPPSLPPAEERQDTD